MGAAEPKDANKAKPKLPKGALLRLGRPRPPSGRAATLLAFSPDGRQVAACGMYSKLDIVDAASGELLRTIDLPGTKVGGSIARRTTPVLAMRYLPDGKTVRVVTPQQKRALDLDVKTARATPRPINQTMYARWDSGSLSRDGKRLAYLVNYHTAAVWDFAAGKNVWRRDFSTKEARFYGVALSPDGRTAACYGYKGGVTVVELAAGAGAKPWHPPHTEGRVRAARLSPDGSKVALATYKSVQVVDLRTGNIHLEAKVSLRQVSHLAFAHDGKTLFVVNGESLKIEQWDVATRKRTREIGRADYSGAIAVSPTGDRLAVSSAAVGVTVYDLKTGEPVGAEATQHRGMVFDAAFSPDDETIVSVGAGGRCIAWDAASGKIRWKPTLKNVPVRVLFMPNGKLVAAGLAELRAIDPKKGTLGRSVAIVSGALAASLGNPHYLHSRLQQIASGNPSYLRYVPQLAAASSSEAVVGVYGSVVARVDVERGRRTGKAWEPGTQAQVVAIAPGAELLLMHHNATHQVLVLTPDGKTTLADLGAAPPYAVWRLSPDLRLAACGESDGTVRVFELASAQRAVSLTGLRSQAFAAAFGPSGRRIAAGNAGGQIVIWDLASGRRVATLSGHAHAIGGLDFSHDGRKLVSSAADGTLIVWAVPPPRRGKALGAEGLKKAWAELGDNAPRAQAAVWRLVDSGDAAVDWIGEQLKPARDPNRQRIAALIERLDSDRFAERQQAQAALRRMGPSVERPARRALARTQSAEQRTRLEQLLSTLERWLVCRGGALRDRRAVRVLELIATPRAREALKTLAAGADGALITRDARRALRRLDLRRQTRSGVVESD